MRAPEPRTCTSTRTTMAAVLRTLVLLALTCTQGTPAAQPDETESPPQAFDQTSGQASDQTGPDQAQTTPWLDEVKRQRRAWEERRRSARQAFEARRHRQPARGSAQQQAWQEDFRRRRKAHLEQMEQDREYFRNLAPYQAPPWATTIEPPASPLYPAPKRAEEPGGSPSQEPGPPAAAGVVPPQAPAPHTPPDWDNLWYFRGF